MGSRKYVDVKFPFLRREPIAWCRGLPRTHKCIGRDTKVRLRKELSRTLIPEKNREAGRTVGSKGGFCPILEKWFEDGFREWSDENLPPNGLTSQTRFKIDDLIKGYLWRRWRAATINTFLRLLDEGKFDYQEQPSIPAAGEEQYRSKNSYGDYPSRISTDAVGLCWHSCLQA